VSSTELPHGWPDGETRPMPYGPVLASGSGIPTGASGIVSLGAIDTGAWPAVAFLLSIGSGGTVYCVATWEFLGGSSNTALRQFYHPADSSVLHIPSWGHRLVDMTFYCDAGTFLTYTVAGSNMQPGTMYQAPATRFMRVADPAAGAANVDLYTVPSGSRATLYGLSYTIFNPARVVPYPLSGSQSETYAGVDLVLRDEDDIPYWRTALWTDNVPFTFAGHGIVSDPDMFTFVSAVTGGNANNVFLFQPNEGLDNTLGEPGTALVKTIAVPLVVPTWLPASHTVQINEWTADSGGSVQNPNGQDPRLLTNRQAPNAGDQIANIALIVGEE
jgi:hypothetical protein